MKKPILALTCVVFSATSFAQMNNMMTNKTSQKNMEMHSMHHQKPTEFLSESHKEYSDINHQMHTGMDISFTGNADIDFLKGMIPHHQGAIDMAKTQLKHGQDGLLKTFTRKVIIDQEREVRSMKRHLEYLEKNYSGHKFNKSTVEFKKGNKKMHNEMNIDFTGNADIDFVKGMIPHHKGAVEMSNIVLKYGNSPFTRRIASGIINSQELEIFWMKRWLGRKNLVTLFS